MDTLGNVLDKLKQIAYQNMPIKGTYIKTLKQEDIFDEPIQKTTELKRVQVGNQSILVPIIKEQEVKPALSDEIVMKLLSRIKDLKSRQILETYKQQEQFQKPPAFPQLPQTEQQVNVEGEEGGDKGEDPALLKERKTELVKKAKEIKTSQEYLQFLDDEKIAEFINDLSKNKLSREKAGFNRSLKLIKDKLSAVDARQKFILEQAEKKRLAEEEKAAKAKAKADAKLAEQQALLLKQQEEQQAKLMQQQQEMLRASQAKTALELSTSTAQATAAQEDIMTRKEAMRLKELRELEVEHSRAEAEAMMRKKHLTEAQQSLMPPPAELTAAPEPVEEVEEPTPPPAAAAAAPPAATPSPKKRGRPPKK
jgi:hypothetical protein